MTHQANEDSLQLLFEICACPVCKSELTHDRNELICKECHTAYEIKNNIPILVQNSEKHLVFEDNIELGKKEAAWNKNKFLRNVYHSWYKKITRYLNEDGISIELSGGNGNFKRYNNRCIASDIRYSKYVDFIANAIKIPLLDKSVDNIVVVDGLHHYNDIWKFFKEVSRVLKKNGRLILIDPYLSVLSNIIRKKFHHEDVDWNSYSTTEKASDANLAIPTKLFFKDRSLFKSKNPELKVLHINAFEILGYPLSGGFNRKNLAPAFMYNIIRALELFLLPLRKLLAFKMIVVIEKN